MRKYYYKDEAGQQQGPVKLDALKTKSLKPETPVWYDPLPKWTTAGEVDELKSLFAAAAPVITTAAVEVKEEVKTVVPEVKKEAEAVVAEVKAEVKEEVKPVVETPVAEIKTETVVAAATPVAEAMDLPPETPKETKVEVVAAPVTPVAPVTATVAAAPVTTTVAAAPVAAKPASIKKKKGPAWVTLVFSLLVLGGAGYFIYQDMESSKSASTIESNNGNNMNEENGTEGNNESNTTNTEANNGTEETTTPSTTDNGNTETTENNQTETAPTTTVPVTTTPTTTVTPTTKTVTNNNAKALADQKAAAKKAEDEKKKQLAAAKKAEEDKNKAANARAAKEMNMRNQWPTFVTIGKLNYLNSDEDIQAFDVPVYNGTDVTIDRVTIRIDYMRKEKKVLKSETIVVNNIPPRSGVNGKAPGSKKGNNVHVYITEIRSKNLHFCYPNGSGTAGDPYYCN